MTGIEIRAPQWEEIPALMEIWREAFPEDGPEEIGDFFALGFAPERSLALYLENRPASVLYWFDGTWGRGCFAYLYAVATKEAARGRGYSSRLIEAVFERLKQEGYDGVLLVPAEPGLFDFYGRLGFAPCCPMTRMSLLGGDGLTPLTPREYEVMRRSFLRPGDGVLTGPALDYFGAEGEFYEGQDGVLALVGIPKSGAPVVEGFGSAVAPAVEDRADRGTPMAMFRALRPGAEAPERFSMTLG